MTHPKITDAPGHIWRKHVKGWECRWQCRTDLIDRGFMPKSQQLYVGEQPNETEIAYIQDTCRRLQDEMLTFGRGGLPVATAFDGTLASLINCYQSFSEYRLGLFLADKLYRLLCGRSGCICRDLSGGANLQQQSPPQNGDFLFSPIACFDYSGVGGHDSIPLCMTLR